MANKIFSCDREVNVDEIFLNYLYLVVAPISISGCKYVGIVFEQRNYILVTPT